MKKILDIAILSSGPGGDILHGKTSCTLTTSIGDCSVANHLAEVVLQSGEADMASPLNNMEREGIEMKSYGEIHSLLDYVQVSTSVADQPKEKRGEPDVIERGMSS